MWLIITTVILIFILISLLYGNIFNARCTSKAIMTGKVVIVTGANSGIGYETAKNLASRGAKVILACRDEKLGEKAKEKIIKATKNNNVLAMKLDLSCLDSIRNFVDEFKRNEVKLDVLINNAGAMFLYDELTGDGILELMQTNYFGPFLLTVLLVPWLKKAEAGRIINVSSALHFVGEIDLENINKEGMYGDVNIYANSKLCIAIFSNELARRLKDINIVSNSLHPGMVRTDIWQNMTAISRNVLSVLSFLWCKSPEQGAQTSIHLAVSEDCDQVTGKYFVDCAETTMSPKAKDLDVAAKLWSYSERLVKLHPHECI